MADDDVKPAEPARIPLLGGGDVQLVKEPDWLVGCAALWEEVLECYRPALWPFKVDTGGVTVVPVWACRVCELSVRGASPELRVWLEWCARGGREAETRARALCSAPRLMARGEALEAIRQLVRGG